MKKLNTINKIYAALLIGVVAATVIKMYVYYSTPRYFYTASFTAPQTYPVYLLDGYLILEGKDEDIKSISYENVNYNRSTWGEGDFNSPDRKERLPKALVVKYASYRDRNFYFDTIPLPRKLIYDVFEGREKENKRLHPVKTAYTFSNPPQLSLVVGLANKGNIVIWLQSENFEKKLLTYHIDPRKPEGELYYQGEKYTPVDYFNHFELTDEYKKAEAKGIDKNANYADSSTHYLQHAN